MKDDIIDFVALISFCFACTGIFIGFFLWTTPGPNDTLTFNIIWTIATVVFSALALVCYSIGRKREQRRTVRSAVSNKYFYDLIDKWEKEREAETK